jgi:hypothetical protein
MSLGVTKYTCLSRKVEANAGLVAVRGPEIMVLLVAGIE